MSVENIAKSLFCTCGSVKFNLLSDGKIKCNWCDKPINKRWITHTDIKIEDLPRWF